VPYRGCSRFLLCAQTEVNAVPGLLRYRWTLSPTLTAKTADGGSAARRAATLRTVSVTFAIYRQPEGGALLHEQSDGSKKASRR